ncbi:MAG: Na+/H+ antiporter subunit E [Firmicutes bacterium]|nr:Na+/H+ antiporter subunit E [Bacillota bacterium]
MHKTTFPKVAATFVVCYAFWLLVTWSVATEELIGGAVVCLAVALFSSRFFIHDHEKPLLLLQPRRLFALVWYCLVVFPGELLKANLDVVRRTFSPHIPLNSGIVKVPVNVRSSYGRAMLADSITLTPGTITMECAEDEGQLYYYIHWLDVKEEDPEKAGDIIKGRMEKWVRRIWD